MTNANGKQDPLSILLGDRVIGYHPALAKIVGGVKTAILLDQLSYWSRRTPPEREGWFYKGVAELGDETGMSDEEQTTARNRLIELGVIEVEYRSYPRRTWYRMNWDRLLEIARAGLPQLPAFPVTGNPSDCKSQSLEKPVTGKTSHRKNQSPGKPVTGNSSDRGSQSLENPVFSHRDSRSLSEGAINELKDIDYSQEITQDIPSSYNPPPTKKQEEEGPLDDRLMQQLLDLGIHECLLPEIDKSGWSSDQLEKLIADCRNSGREPAGLFMWRIRMTKPKHGSGYTHLQNATSPQADADDDPGEPDPDEAIKAVWMSAVDAARSTLTQTEYNALMREVVPVELDGHILVVRCRPIIWNAQIAPRAEIMLARLNGTGITDIARAE